MATWTTIPDASINIGKPVRSIDGFALRDNPIAIAEGASGAPKVLNKALQNTLVGDVPLNFNDTERSNSSATYVKLKETVIARTGALRIKFDLKSNSGALAFGRIYINGIAIGTERSQTSSTYGTYSEDIAGLNRNDLIQIYGKISSPTMAVQNLRLYCDDAADNVAIL